MRKCALVVGIGLLCLVFGAAPAIAQDDWGDDEGGGDEIDRARKGFFLAATANFAVDNFSLPASEGFSGSSGREFDRSGIDNSWGFSFRGGWRFNPILAAEGHLEYLNDFGYHGNDLTQSRSLKLSQQRVVSFYANGRAYIPGILDGWIQPYAVAGFGFLATERFGTAPDLTTPISTGYRVGPAVRGGVGLDIYGYGSDQAGFNIETAYVVGLADVWATQYLVTNFGLFYRW